MENGKLFRTTLTLNQSDFLKLHFSRHGKLIFKFLGFSRPFEPCYNTRRPPYLIGRLFAPLSFLFTPSTEAILFVETSTKAFSVEHLTRTIPCYRFNEFGTLGYICVQFCVFQVYSPGYNGDNLRLRKWVGLECSKRRLEVVIQLFVECCLGTLVHTQADQKEPRLLTPKECTILRQQAYIVTITFFVCMCDFAWINFHNVFFYF